MRLIEVGREELLALYVDSITHEATPAVKGTLFATCDGVQCHGTDIALWEAIAEVRKRIYPRYPFLDRELGLG